MFDLCDGGCYLNFSELAYQILVVFEFDDDHLYEFNMSNVTCQPKTKITMDNGFVFSNFNDSNRLATLAIFRY